MGRKPREDEPLKDFRNALKAMGKPPKKEKKLDKIVKHLSKNDKT
jgi:hypothetical protein